MRSEAEQIEGLKIVQRAMWRLHRQLDTPIVMWLGDVVQLLHRGARGASVVYVTGGYDGWIDGGLEEPDMTSDQAVQWLLSKRSGTARSDEDAAVR